MNLRVRTVVLEDSDTGERFKYVENPNLQTGRELCALCYFGTFMGVSDPCPFPDSLCWGDVEFECRGLPDGYWVKLKPKT